MQSSYLCPKCNAHLQVGKCIIFYVVSTQSKKRGLVMLNSNLGEYKSINHPSLSFDKGEYVEFFCPVCHANLAESAINSNLVKIIMINNETGDKSDVYFSKIAGEKSTFRINEDESIEQYGEDAYRYINFFNLAQLG